MPFLARVTRSVFHFLLLLALLSPIHAEHFYRPAPYIDGIIYLLSRTDRTPKFPSADYVRTHATRVIHLEDTVGFWDELRWLNARHDSKIKRRAGPLTTVIDLYERVQGAPPARPEFETLYGTERFLYSSGGDYLALKPPTSTLFARYLKRSMP